MIRDGESLKKRSAEELAGWPEAKRLGYECGYEQPVELTGGYSWEGDEVKNEQFSMGANLGQHDGAADKGLLCQACREGWPHGAGEGSA
jgi:hypothetical protein